MQNKYPNKFSWKFAKYLNIFQCLNTRYLLVILSHLKSWGGWLKMLTNSYSSFMCPLCWLPPSTYLIWTQNCWEGWALQNLCHSNLGYKLGSHFSHLCLWLIILKQIMGGFKKPINLLKVLRKGKFPRQSVFHQWIR